MSSGERTGFRDLTYSMWHREANLRPVLGRRAAWELGMVDIDGCEYCVYCKEALALIETQRSTAPPKNASVTAGLAHKAGLPAYSVSVVAEAPNYCTDCGAPLPATYGPIRRFRVRQIEPYNRTELVSPLDGAVGLSPEEYARWLHSIHQACACRAKREAIETEIEAVAPVRDPDDWSDVVVRRPPDWMVA